MKISTCLIVFVLLVSCQKLAGGACHIISPYAEKNMSLNTWKSDFKFWIGASKTVNDSSYEFAIATKKVDSIQLHSWFESNSYVLNKSEIKSGNVASIALYTKTDDKDTIVSTNDILGASVYYVLNGKLKVAVFEKKENEMKIIPFLNVEIDKIPVMDFYKTAILFRGSSKSVLKTFLVSTDNFTAERMKEAMYNSNGDFAKILNNYKSVSLR